MENELRFINDDIKSKYIDGTEVVGIGSEGCVYDFYNKVNKINKKTYTRRKRNEYIFYLRAKIGEYHLHFFTKSKSS